MVFSVQHPPALWEERHFFLCVPLWRMAGFSLAHRRQGKIGGRISAVRLSRRPKSLPQNSPSEIKYTKSGTFLREKCFQRSRIVSFYGVSLCIMGFLCASVLQQPLAYAQWRCASTHPQTVQGAFSPDKPGPEFFTGKGSIFIPKPFGQGHGVADQGRPLLVIAALPAVDLGA